MKEIFEKSKGFLGGLMSIAVGVVGIWGTREFFLSEKINEVQTQVEKCRDSVTEAKIQVIQLTYDLKVKVNKHKIIEKYLDSLPFPAWVKQQTNDGQFVMIMINDAYVNLFGKSKELYQGKTDFEIWPEDLAKVYHMNDRIVAETFDYHRSLEYVLIDGRKRQVEVWKFSVRLSETVYGVGGIIVDRTR